MIRLDENGMKPDAEYQCLLCGSQMGYRQIDEHKSSVHRELDVYSFMRHVPTGDIAAAFARDYEAYESGMYRGLAGSHTLQALAPYGLDESVLFAGDGNAEGDNPVHESEVLAQALGVKKVYVRDEGQNPTGSHKDYMVAAAVMHGVRDGHTRFTAVSSGNHAVALARYAGKVDAKANVFIPADSGKVPVLESLDNVEVFRVRNRQGASACYEDVYEAYARLTNAGYNANASNELIYDLIQQACVDTVLKIGDRPLPTHVLSGVGNGSYIGMLGRGFNLLSQAGVIKNAPRMVPVGMDGGFPTEDCIRAEGRHILEYRDFRRPLEDIEAAEGAIAIASYSMPHAVRAVRETGGFALGGLTNEDLRKAYGLLKQDRELLGKGAIPEPTGIMSLAAAIRYRERFTKDDVLMLCFTGHAAKDAEELSLLLGDDGADLASLALDARADIRMERSSHMVGIGDDISELLGDTHEICTTRS